MFTNKTLAFIGTGNMSEAIIRGLLTERLVSPSQIIGSNPLVERNTLMEDAYGIQVTTSNLQAIVEAEIVVLAVKPQVFGLVSAEIKNKISPTALVVSIMAGTTIDTIRQELDHNAIARSMPNTPAQIGQGMTVWTTTNTVTTTQRQQAQAIFAALGAEVEVAGEHYLDMATALNGSGPGYVFLILEAMIDAGVHMGFARPIAKQIVMQTVAGSVAYAQQSDQHLAELRNQVTSPAGTTAAGLHTMEKLGIRSVLSDGIWAAYERSVALGR
ncbi:MAG TPA: pyrroline-5-carboxylate reductase [Anaerolineae bacterium]|nr:pyrroline-5-carboxylate reductase [Anaerolineae bacterium]